MKILSRFAVNGCFVLMLTALLLSAGFYSFESIPQMSPPVAICTVFLLGATIWLTFRNTLAALKCPISKDKK